VTRASHPRWGQNFLVDVNVARAIVDWADIKGRNVLEIGPGRGALTRWLAAQARHLTLLEIDTRLVAELRETYADASHVIVQAGDALRVDLRTLAAQPFHVVASLPYESGTAIVRRLVEAPALVREAVVMLQKEVCQRMIAAPGSKSYGVLSVHMTMHADITAGRTVGPSAFRPRPQVESQLLRIRPLTVPRWEHGDPRHFSDVVRIAFAERRKMLRNTLGRWFERGLGTGSADDVFTAAGVDPTQRPETVPVAGFARLAAVSRAMLERDA
jgi:16S rRNA (adenine1518-N6/adenine1519-N6)-dimethyltransferase